MMSSVCPVPQAIASPREPTMHWSTPRRSSYSTSNTSVITLNASPITNESSRTRWSPFHRPQSAPGFYGHYRLSAPAAPFIETEEEYVEFYQARIVSAQQRQLLPLQEDLADWLNKLLGTSHVTAENFMSALDDGLVVCRLAKYIQQQAKEAVDQGRAKGPVPTMGGRVWQNAAKRSFFSRDNTENFIRFCRQLGVHENLLFESDDLVTHAAPRNVVLCLHEVSRLAASKFGLEASGLVQLEREIAECVSPGRISPIQGAALSDSGMSAASANSWRPASPDPIPLPDGDKQDFNSCNLSLGSPDSSGRWSRPGSADEDDTDTWRQSNNATKEVSQVVEHTNIISPRTEERGLSELDRKVEQAARVAQEQCRCGTSDGKCEKLKVRRLGAGKYNIAGRNVFVRLLKGRHMMVRVGGGWDTLEHFLERHDPCQVRVLSRGDVTPSPRGGPARRQSSPGTTSEGFLHIRAKYRSPPPARS